MAGVVFLFLSRGWQPFRSSLSLARHAIEKNKVLDSSSSLGGKFHSAVWQRTGSPFSRGTHSPIFCQIRLASLARNCGDRVRDPPDSRTRCLSSVQRVRTSQFLPAPVPLDEFSCQPDPVPLSRSLGSADSPYSGRTDSIFDSDSDHWKLRRGAPGKESTQLRAKHQTSAQSSTRVTSNIVGHLPDRWAFNVDASQTVGNRRSAALWAPSMAERDIFLPGQTASEHQRSPAQPVVRRSDAGQTSPPPQW